MGISRLQVEAQHYQPRRYDTLSRFVSYWYQIDLVMKARPCRVIEVGIGTGFTSRYLRAQSIDVVSVDLDRQLHPTVAADVARGLPFANGSFDVAACFEVLEHLQWNEFHSALSELARVSRLIILSLPDVTPLYKVNLALPLLGTWNTSFTIPWTRWIPWRRPPQHLFDGEHYWEVGKRGTEQPVVRHALERHGAIAHEMRPVINPYHHFYAVRVRDA